MIMQFLGSKLGVAIESFSLQQGVWKINLVQFPTIRTIDECVGMKLCLQLYDLS